MAKGGEATALHDVAKFKVLKKLAPASPGAIKLAVRYGEALVCVRHRTDPARQTRVTTVELVVDTAPIQHRSEALVAVRLGWGQRALRAAALAEGATWDARAKVWRMPMSVARALGVDRLVVKQ
jgi:hypothetical protein